MILKTPNPDSHSAEPQVGYKEEGQRVRNMNDDEPTTPLYPFPRLPSQAVVGRLIFDVGSI